MNWTQIEGQWTEFKGHAKSRWGKLTDDDLKIVAGKRDQLLGKLQQHYGIVKDEAEKQLDQWVAKLQPGAEKAKVQDPVKASTETSP